MATLTLKQGDLFSMQADAIGHGVNTHGIMGAGIAVLFRKKYPEMHERYMEYCEIFREELVGTSFVYPVEEDNTSHVANIFSQEKPGADARVDYLIEGIKDTYATLWGDQRVDAPHLAIPLIGCGIGGLEWDSEVYPALQQLVAELPADWRLTVCSVEPREGFTI